MRRPARDYLRVRAGITKDRELYYINAIIRVPVLAQDDASVVSVGDRSDESRSGQKCLCSVDPVACIRQ